MNILWYCLCCGTMCPNEWSLELLWSSGSHSLFVYNRTGTVYLHDCPRANHELHKSRDLAFSSYIFNTEQNIWYVSRMNGWVKTCIWNLWNDLLDDFYSDPLRPSISLKKPAQATKFSNFLLIHPWTHAHMQVHTYTPSSETVLWSRVLPAPTHLNQTLYLYPSLTLPNQEMSYIAIMKYISCFPFWSPDVLRL